MIFGGVPYFHDKNVNANSLESILNNIFSLLTSFKNEIVLNLRMSTTLTTNYFSILYEISKGNNSFSKIQQTTKIDSNLTHYLNTLIDMGLIHRITNFKLSKSKIVLYSISDRFSAFWFRYFYIHERELTLLPVNTFIQTIVIPTIDEFLNLPFEEFSRQIISYLALKEYFDEPIVTITNYAGFLNVSGTKQKKDFEIDMVGESITGKFLVLGECKWTKKIDEWDVKSFLENKSYFTIKFQDYVNKFENIHLIFLSKVKISNSLKKKYSDIDFIDLELLETLLDKSV